MALKLPRLQRLVAIVNDGAPTLVFHQWWQKVAEALEKAISDIQDSVAAIEAALTAANIALDAATTAQAAADAAQAAADAAAASGGGNAAATNLALSYPDGITITSSDNGLNADIEISGHNRIYGDGTSVAVLGDILTGLTYGTKYYLYYDDPTRVGGAVTYVATTNINTAAQSGNRHTVGSITTATSGGVVVTGNRLRPPGTVGL